MSEQSPSAPTASAVGLCPTIIKISRTLRHWRFTRHHHTTRPLLDILCKDKISHKSYKYLLPYFCQNYKFSFCTMSDWVLYLYRVQKIYYTQADDLKKATNVLKCHRNLKHFETCLNDISVQVK